MIFSMTGFGRAEYEDGDISLSAEIKSLNHRFFEVSFYLPEGFGIFEERLREKLAKEIRRGRVFFNLSYSRHKPEGASVFINYKLTRQITQDLKRLSKSLGLKHQVNIGDVITLPHIIKIIPQAGKKVHLEKKIMVLADKAINNLICMRKEEGAALLSDLKNCLGRANKALERISEESPRAINRFKNKLSSYLHGKDYSAEKLVEEVGVFARNIDISEEIARLKSHLNNFWDTLDGKAVEKGRTLDFIAQEMQREINTIGAKSSSMKISQQVVVIKSEIDKVREQLSNVE